MIAIVSSQPQERTALGALCDSHRWPWLECDSVRSFQQLLRHNPPKIILARHRLSDGYSDDLISVLITQRILPGRRLLILADASLTSNREARQIALGADHVLRDPVRAEVLFAYLGKYQKSTLNRPGVRPVTRQRSLRLAGALINPVERTARRGRRTTPLTSREVELAEALAASSGHVVTYATLYSEILGRRFRGDTSNLRVLFGKLAASLAKIGTNLRTTVTVIPKTGYRVSAL